jgi:hypothetical protein
MALHAAGMHYLRKKKSNADASVAVRAGVVASTCMRCCCCCWFEAQYVLAEAVQQRSVQRAETDIHACRWLLNA